jgi:hypothetical protein
MKNIMGIIESAKVTGARIMHSGTSTSHTVLRIRC